MSINSPSDMELSVTLQIKAQKEEIKKIKKELTDLGIVVDKANKKGIRGSKEAQSAVKSLTSQVSNMRRAVLQVGVAWSTASGLAIYALNLISNKVKSLNALSMQTGIKVSDLSRRTTGIDLTSSNMTAGMDAWERIVEAGKRGGYKAAGKATELFGEASVVVDKSILQGEREGLKWYQSLLRDARDETKEKLSDMGKWWDDFYYKHLGPEKRKADMQSMRNAISNMLQTMGGVPNPFTEKGKKLYNPNNPNSITDFGKGLAGQMNYLPINLTPPERDKADEQIVRATQKKKTQELRANYDRNIILEKQFYAEIQRMQGNSFEYWKTIQDNKREIYKEDIGPDGKITTLFEELYDLQAHRMKLAEWGLKDMFQTMEEAKKQFGSGTVRMFGDVFIDALDNKLQGARAIFGSFLMDVRNMFIRSMVEGLGSSLWGTVTSWFSGWGGGGGTAQGMGSMTQYNQMSNAAHAAGYAEGGYAGLNGPELAVVGEQGPEYIVPNHQLGKTQDNGKGGTTNVSYFINAVDAKSFAELVARNPKAIVAVTADALQKGKNIRKVIREYT